MYIVVTTPLATNYLHNPVTLTVPSIEYFQTKEQLIERLKKGGNIRVFEATELDFDLQVSLTLKEQIPGFGGNITYT